MPGAGNGTTLGIIAGVGTIGVALVPIDEGEIVGAGVITDWGERSGADVGVRVQAVRAIEPIPINNLKYFTLNLINIDIE